MRVSELVAEEDTRADRPREKPKAYLMCGGTFPLMTRTCGLGSALGNASTANQLHELPGSAGLDYQKTVFAPRDRTVDGSKGYENANYDVCGISDDLRPVDGDYGVRASDSASLRRTRTDEIFRFVCDTGCAKQPSERANFLRRSGRQTSLQVRRPWIKYDFATRVV